jgi:hypothetical protein
MPPHHRHCQRSAQVCLNLPCQGRRSKPERQLSPCNCCCACCCMQITGSAPRASMSDRCMMRKQPGEAYMNDSSPPCAPTPRLQQLPSLPQHLSHGSHQ